MPLVPSVGLLLLLQGLALKHQLPKQFGVIDDLLHGFGLLVCSRVGILSCFLFLSVWLTLNQLDLVVLALFGVCVLFERFPSLIRGPELAVLRLLFLLLHLLLELLSLSFLLTLGQALLVCVGKLALRLCCSIDVAASHLVLGNGLGVRQASLSACILDVLEDLRRIEALRAVLVDDLGQRLAIIFEPELLPDQLILVRDHQIELLHHGIAGG